MELYTKLSFLIPYIELYIFVVRLKSIQSFDIIKHFAVPYSRRERRRMPVRLSSARAIVVWWLLVVGGGCGCFGCLWAAGGCVVVGFCVVVGGLSVVCALWLVIGGGFVVAVCGA